MRIQTTAHFEFVVSDIQQGILAAVLNDDIAAIQAFLADGKNPAKVMDADGFTPLHLAAQHGRYEIMELLLSNKMPVDLKSREGFTPLHMAANSGQLMAMKLLIDKGAKVTAKNNNGLTALHIAASGNQPEVMRFLLEQDFSVNEKDSFGFTSLHVSAYYGFDRAVDILLAHGANCAARNIKGETPAKVAINNDQHKVAGLLMQKQIEQICSKKADKRIRTQAKEPALAGS